MSTFTNFYAKDADGDTVTVQESSAPTKGFAFLMTATDGVWLDRENAVGVIEALTDLIEAADAREAEAAKRLKRGDKVRLSSVNTDHRYTVVTDESDAGRVEVVAWGDGVLWSNQRANLFERIPEATR